MLLRGAADWLSARAGLSPRIMLPAIVLGLFVVGAGLLYWVGPRLSQQGQDLASTLTQQLNLLRQHLETTSWGQPLAKDLSQPAISAQRVVAPAETAALLTTRVLAGIVVLLVTTLYLAVSPELYSHGVLRLVPLPHRPRMRQIMVSITHVLRFWFVGQLVDMLTVGVLSAIGLLLVGVPVPYALGTLAGVLTFVPYFGAILGSIPAIMVAMTVDWSTALWAAGVFLVCHIVEGYLVAPLVQQRLVDLPPALTILGITVMGTLFGPLGIIIGTPFAAATLVVVREVYVRDVLGDVE